MHIDGAPRLALETPHACNGVDAVLDAMIILEDLAILCHHNVRRQHGDGASELLIDLFDLFDIATTRCRDSPMHASGNVATLVHNGCSISWI